MTNKKVLIVGGAGYVGTEVSQLLTKLGVRFDVLDTFWYWKNSYEYVQKTKLNGNIHNIDLRNIENHSKIFEDVETILYLACVSNDPTYDLNPDLGKTINYDGFLRTVKLADRVGIKKFIFASSSSVYGVKEEENVTEDLTPEPLTDYSRFKLECELYLQRTDFKNLEWTIIRPATVCGWSTRMRFDLVVNILTYSAIINNEIVVHGGSQFRPNLHIKDMAELYSRLIMEDTLFEKSKHKVFNYGCENIKLIDIANLVKESMSQQINLKIENVVDSRSYRISSEYIKKELGVKPKYSVKDAIDDINYAFREKLLRPVEEQYLYNNIKTMTKLINENKLII